MQKKVVFITGAAGGLGRATVEYFSARGWQVFAADYDQQGLASLEKGPGVIPVPVDISQAESVEAAFQFVTCHVEGLEGIINMAGVMQVGSMVEMDEAALLRLLNINVMGMFRINRCFLPLILKSRGRIINISSENGWESGGPFNGAYSMSKHAVEAYTDSLRRELLLLGIQVIKVQPGPFKTGMITTTKQLFIDATRSSVHFKPQLRFISGMMDGVWKNAKPPVILARVIYHAMTSRYPRTAYSVRPDIPRALLDLLPAFLADGLLKVILKSADRKGGE